MFHLTSRNGPAKGASWVISATPLVLGRDIICDLTVNDPMVSRRHCEIEEQNDGVWIKDLGSSNATFVNGEAVQRAQVHTGDEIAVGGAIFYITEVRETGGASGAHSSSPAATHSLRIGEPTFLDRDGDSLFSHGKPRTAEDLAVLFNIGRALSQANTTAGLITTLMQRVGERFSPESFWIALCQGKGEPLLVYPPEESADVTANESLHEIVWRAIREPKGILFPERWSYEGTVGIRTTMVAPISLAREPVGAMIAQADTPKRMYDEGDLEFFLAIAHAAAPYLKAVERLEQLERENRRLVAGTPNAEPIIGASQAINRVRVSARNCARSGLNVLLLGETGTGKELVARMIHDLSDRADKPLTIVNCAAIPNELFESEVFGHERGAFTGAHSTKTGLFEESNGGTLFLDEVGDTSPQNQARLLRAIETGTFRRVGGTADIHVEVRVISATNKNIAAAVAAGQFRRDLYHRLNAFEIPIPPLREHRMDVPVLAEYFLRQAKERFRTALEGFSPEALQVLHDHAWPGNVRELRNVIERAVIVARHNRILPEDLAAQGGPAEEQTPFLSLEEVEKRHVAKAIQECNGNMKAAADLLRIGRSTLYRKVADYKIPT